MANATDLTALYCHGQKKNTQMKDFTHRQHGFFWPSHCIRVSWKSALLTSSPLGHFRDPNNQLQVVKNLRISVNSIVTNVNVLPAALTPAQCQLLSDTVYSSQPQEGAASNVVITGDYNLNVCGKWGPSSAWLMGLKSLCSWFFFSVRKSQMVTLPLCI